MTFTIKKGPLKGILGRNKGKIPLLWGKIMTTKDFIKKKKKKNYDSKRLVVIRTKFSDVLSHKNDRSRLKLSL